MTKIGYLTFITLLLIGCASQRTPQAIQTPLPKSPSLTQVRIGEVEEFSGAEVRWGGKVVKVENQSTDTLIEVVAYELQGNGRPIPDDSSPGRFLARVDGFLDPTIYEPGRLWTVVGRLEGKMSRPIGGYAYTYPIVQVGHHHLWPGPSPDRRRGYYYPRHYPYYYPYYGPTPYYRGPPWW